MVKEKNKAEHLMLTTSMLPEEIAKKLRMPVTKILEIRVSMYTELLKWRITLSEEIEDIDEIDFQPILVN